jgi:CRISPR-associated protein Cas2
MEKTSYRVMRLLVLFDMPVETDDERREYVHFRKFIMDDGFLMLQYSVYSRFCANDSDSEKHINRIKGTKPKYGNIRIISLTDNQFSSMVVVQGEKSEQENKDEDDLIVID